MSEHNPSDEDLIVVVTTEGEVLLSTPDEPMSELQLGFLDILGIEENDDRSIN